MVSKSQSSPDTTNDIVLKALADSSVKAAVDSAVAAIKAVLDSMQKSGEVKIYQDKYITIDELLQHYKKDIVGKWQEKGNPKHTMNFITGGQCTDQVAGMPADKFIYKLQIMEENIIAISLVNTSTRKRKQYFIDELVSKTLGLSDNLNSASEVVLFDRVVLKKKKK